MTTSINTNISAYYAQNNLRAAGTDAQFSIARLSSGNKIIRASDDAAGLSIGTILRTDVNTLKTALTNTNQGSTLLQIADGAMERIGEILQRQKALTTQANSGTLGTTEKGYLNTEFQKLTAELDRIAATTNFNGVKLLDGSLFNGSAIKSESIPSLAAQVAIAGITYTIPGAPGDATNITVNGATVTFTTDATRTDRVLVGATVTETATNLTNFLNSSTDGRVAIARYSSAAGVVTATYSGAGAVHALTFGFADGTYTAGTPAGTTFTADTDRGNINARVSATGNVGDSILNSLNLQATGSTGTAGINVNAIRNNTDFLGTLSGFTVTYLTGTTASVEIRVGDVLYKDDTVDFSAGATIVLTGQHDDDSYNDTYGVGSFTLTTGAAVTPLDAALGTQEQADIIASRLDQAFSSVSFVASRDITTYKGEGRYATGTVDTVRLDDSAVDFRSGDFSNVVVEDIKVTAPLNVGGEATVEFTINGSTYKNVNSIGDRLGLGGMIILSNIENPSELLTIQLGSTALADFASTTAVYRNSAEALTFENALKDAFGVGQGGSALQFQVGTDSADTISIAIEGVNSEQLYVVDGQAVDMDLVTGDIDDISAALDNAINQVTARRAEIGAAQSRFEFAAATLEISVQNLDAARGTFLDADISEESTKFAQAQVLVQASIAVLAQANQLPQNLLKLIG